MLIRMALAWPSPGRRFALITFALAALAVAHDAPAFQVFASYETFEVTSFGIFRSDTHRSGSVTATGDQASAMALLQPTLDPIDRLGVSLVGSLDAHAQAGSWGAGADGTVTPNAFASFGRFDITVRTGISDAMTFTSTDPNATRVRVSYTLDLHGGFQPSRSFPGGASTAVFLTGTGIPPGPYGGSLYGQLALGDFGLRIDQPAPPRINGQFEAVVGAPTPVSMTFTTFGSASATNDDRGAGTATFIVDFQRTLTWGGITSVVDAVTGLPVTNWSVTSDSGFNYANAFVEPGAAVPEPQTGALIVLALATLGFARLRRLASGSRERRGLMALANRFV